MIVERSRKKELINHKLYYCCFSYQAVESHASTLRRSCVHAHARAREKNKKQKKAATCCQWKMQEWSYDSCGPQRLAAGPIWQTCVSHTYTHTHTSQLYLLLWPNDLCRAKMSLAPESLGIFSGVLHINLVFCFYNFKDLLYGVCIHSELDNTHISERLSVNPSLFSHCDLI